MQRANAMEERIKANPPSILEVGMKFEFVVRQIHECCARSEFRH